MSNKKKLIIFDLDGVLIDSKKNMDCAWKSVRNRYKINISFKKYFEHVGKPFKNILNKIGISDQINLIEREYTKSSIKNFKKIRLYKSVKKTLNSLRKTKNIYTAIVTSKNKNRTKKIIKLHNLKLNYIQCPEKNLRGKPYPDQILKVIKKFNIKKKNCLFVGDTIYDKQAARRSNIKFIFAKYGYKIGIKNYKYSIKNISEVLEFIHEK